MHDNPYQSPRDAADELPRRIDTRPWFMQPLHPATLGIALAIPVAVPIVIALQWLFRW